MVHGDLIGHKERDSGQASGSDGEALGDSSGGVANGVKRVGAIANLLQAEEPSQQCRQRCRQQGRKRQHRW